MEQMILYFVVSFLACVVGAICGIGGGVIIKPVLDLMNMGNAAVVSFLSGCTVLAMTGYSVGKSLLQKEKSVDLTTGTPLALGAALGGVAGKQLFSYLLSMFPNPETVGRVQAVCLGLITMGTLLYTINKSCIRTRHTENKLACAGIGLALGIMSSFLGIGGGPINLVVLYYFFSMDTKTAAANSLYIILFSQAASLIVTIASRAVPAFPMLTLVLMVAGGISGGIAGRAMNKKMDNRAVDKLFIGLMVIIIGICIYNSL